MAFGHRLCNNFCMRLTPHFDLSEFVVSQTASRYSIDNTPSPDIVEALAVTARLLEEVRALLGKPILITSGYRCSLLNLAVGGVPGRSSHTTGHAADFHSPGYGSPLEICKAIEGSSIVYDQLIWEYQSWVHIGWAVQPRMMALTIDAAGTRYGLA